MPWHALDLASAWPNAEALAEALAKEKDAARRELAKKMKLKRT
jgi:hypothetical protein